MIRANKKIFKYLEQGRKNGTPLLALRGGRRAGKTFAVCQWLLLQMFNEGDVVIFANMTAEQGRKGTYEDCKSIFNLSPDFAEYFEMMKAPREIRCNIVRDGKCGVGYFASYQDPETAKGGACDWVFINEANKFSYQQYLDLSANARKGVIVDYNPNVKFWIDDILQEEDILQVTWKDNLKHLTEQQKQWFENLYTRAHSANATQMDWYYYKVYYEGVLCEIGGEIFNEGNLQFADITPTFVKMVVFCDPSALRGADYFACVLLGQDVQGDVYLVDSMSTNVGRREDIAKQIKQWGSEWDNVRMFCETNGLVGIDFFEFAQNSGLPIESYYSRGNKFERIIANYQELTERLKICNTERNKEFMKQVYDFSKTCEHDDNADALNSGFTLFRYL